MACVALVVLLIETSADDTAESAGADDDELPPFGSLVALLTLALFEIEPLAPAATRVTSVNVAVAPLASVAALQEIVPLAPTAGVVQLKPAGALIDWNSSDDGS